MMQIYSIALNYPSIALVVYEEDTMAAGVKERLIKFLDDQKISKSEFGRRIGVSNAYVTSIRKSLDSDKIKSIALNFPNLNLTWLLTGNEQMLKSVSPTFLLSERLSTICSDLQNQRETAEHIAQLLGISKLELINFNNNFKFPSKPFDFVRFLSEYPEFNFQWIMTGEGQQFNGDEEDCLRQINERIKRNTRPNSSPKEENKEDETLKSETHDNNLWEQIHFQNEQLKEKDQQIKEKDVQIIKLMAILDILQKK